MKKITDIYNEYNIMPNLQLHQLRVAAVASLICESLDVEVDKNNIISACLLHDMGNIIKSKLGHFPEYEESKNIEYWKTVQDEYIKKYGFNEHVATLEILKELKLPENIISLVDSLRFHKLCDDKEGPDIDKKILHYVDGRVGPYGILSYNERNEDARIRYMNHPRPIEKNEWEKLINCGREIEKQIFSHSNIKPDDINDQSVAKDIELLKNFEI